MPLECSHSFRNFILWVGSKSTTLNDFWKPLWCTDTQAYTFTQQSLKFFRFLCRPIQSPQHLEGKKQLEPPTPTSSLQPDAILYQHLTFLTTRTHHCAPGPPASSALLHPTSESPAFGSQDSWDGGPFLRCNVASRVVKWPLKALQGCGAVHTAWFQLIGVYIPCTKHDIKKIWSGSMWGTL